MKKQVTTILSFLVIGLTAQAAFPMPNESVARNAELTQFTIGHTWLGQINGGNVTVDVAGESIRLVLTQAPKCEENMVCLPVFEEYHEIEVRLFEVAELGCNIRRYRGLKDDTPADGLLQEITVIDSGDATCRLTLEFLTEVTFETFNPWTQEVEVSEMKGGFLKPFPELHN